MIFNLWEVISLGALSQLGQHKRRLARQTHHLFTGKPNTPKTNSSLDDSWQEIEFNVEGVDHHVPCYYRPVENPKGLIAFCGGMKTCAASYQETVEHLNAQGYSVVITNFPFPEKFDNGAQDLFTAYTKIQEAFYGSEDSPAYKIAAQHNLPVHVMTHSTAGLVFNKLMQQSPNNFAGFVQDKTIGATHISPFFTAAGACPRPNKQFNAAARRFGSDSWARLIFLTHAMLNKNTVYGDHFIELAYALLNSNRRAEERLPYKALPRYKEILTLMHHGESLYKDIERRGAANFLPQYSNFVLGMNDPNSCSSFGKRLGEMIGADIIEEEDGLHDPLKNNTTLINHLISLIDQDVIQHRQRQQQSGLFIQPQGSVRHLQM